jgi:uncharacterized protein YcfJ
VKWATNCADPRPAFCAMGFTNSGSASRAFTTVSCTSFTEIAAVVSHGPIKERVVPPKEIDRVVERKKRFEVNPRKHTYEEA